MKGDRSDRMRTVNIIVAVLVLVTSVMMFLPFWHYGDQSVSINSYVWMPSEHAELEKYFVEELGHKTDINQIVRMPALMFLPGWIGVVLCLVKRNNAWHMICTLPFGILGVISFLSCDALRIGSAWWLMMILCFAIILADLIGLLSAQGK